jgi:uncharacterized protein YsxB (DUF464 family)
MQTQMGSRQVQKNIKLKRFIADGPQRDGNSALATTVNGHSGRCGMDIDIICAASTHFIFSTQQA